MPENEKDNTKLVHVLRRANGLTVSNRRVLMDDLLKGLYAMMEPNELTALILAEEKFSLHQIFGPILEGQNPKVFFKCLELVVSRCNSEEDMRYLSLVLRALAERFDLSQVEEGSLNNLLMLLIGKVERLYDEDVLLQLFSTLLKQLNIAEGRKEIVGILLRMIAERARTEKDIDIKRWFQEQITSYMPVTKTVTTPLLPPGTILYQEEISGRKIVVLEVEKSKRDILYYKTPYESVGHPKLLFEFVIRGKEIEQCRIFALKDGPVKASSRLYRYPFGNVFPDFHACWPQLKEIEITQLSQLRRLPELFFKSSTNDHAYRGKNLRELYISLQGQDFNEETLLDTRLTVADQFELLSIEDEIEESQSTEEQELNNQ
ncbi:E2 family protein D [Paenibacillus sp. PDC88]|nr:E2 family protein D [Paenibacillus sp. PDC88]SFS88450.1 E2 family protein D [Paenibacillus sp. 453mf]